MAGLALLSFCLPVPTDQLTSGLDDCGIWHAHDDITLYMARPRSIWYDAVRIRGISQETSSSRLAIASTPCIHALLTCHVSRLRRVRCWLRALQGPPQPRPWSLFPLDADSTSSIGGAAAGVGEPRPEATGVDDPGPEATGVEEPDPETASGERARRIQKKRSRSEAACLRGDVYPAAVRKVCCCDIDPDLLVVAQIGAADVVWKGLTMHWHLK